MTLCLDINCYPFTDPLDEDLDLRHAVLVVRTMVTVYLSICLVSNAVLVVGVIKGNTKLFFPHFFVAPCMIPLSISCTVYCIIAPGQLSFASTGVIFALMEVTFLYATVSHYKQLKAKELNKGESFTT